MDSYVDLTNDFFQGAVSLEHGPGWVRPWRIPCDLSPLFHDALVETAGTPAGVRIRVATRARNIGLTVTPEPAEQRNFDLVFDNERIETVTLPENQTEVRFAPLPDSVPRAENVLELYLPQRNRVRVCHLLLEEGAQARPAPDRRKRWTTYGSSITHCGSAHGPSRTWPAAAARKHDLNLTCLGFGGQCHLDPMMARIIRDRPADLITLKLGINVHGGGTLNERTFAPGAIGFVQIIRENHPATPIVVISPIYCPGREDEKGTAGLSLRDMRDALADAVARMRACGDERISYLSGLELFDESLADHLPDGLHPDGEGYLKMAENVSGKILAPAGF